MENLKHTERTERKAGYVFALPRSDTALSPPEGRIRVKGAKKVRQKKYPKMFTKRATEGEHERLVSRAKEAQLSLSRFLVECGLSQDAPTWEDRQQRERAIIQLIRAGDNLNQIATVVYQDEPDDHDSNEGEGTRGNCSALDR